MARWCAGASPSPMAPTGKRKSQARAETAGLWGGTFEMPRAVPRPCAGNVDARAEHLDFSDGDGSFPDRIGSIRCRATSRAAESVAMRRSRDPIDRLPHEPRPVVVISSKGAGTDCRAGARPQGSRERPAVQRCIRRPAARLGCRSTARCSTTATALPSCRWASAFPGTMPRGSDLPPRRECAPHWRQQVISAMPQIELVLAIGQYAQAWHLGAERRAER